MHDIPILAASVYTFLYLKDNFTSASVSVVFPQERRIHYALKNNFTKNRSFVCLVISHTTYITPHRS